jgi:hypothetical protein
MLMEVVDPEPLTGDHVPFRKETGKSESMEGERGVVVETGAVKRGLDGLHPDIPTSSVMD